MSAIVDLVAWMMCIIVSESGEEMLREELIEVRRVVRKCWRTSGDDDPVMKAYD